MDESDPLENYRLIRNELIQYKPELGQRPELVVVTKSELPGAEEVSRRLEEATGQPVLLISAATGSRLDFLTGRIAEMLAEQNRA